MNGEIYECFDINGVASTTFDFEADYRKPFTNRFQVSTGCWTLDSSKNLESAIAARSK